MDITQAKQQVESNNLKDTFVIFKYKDVPFVAYQYINKIHTELELPINYLDNLDSLGVSQVNLFATTGTPKQINVFSCEELDYPNEKLKDQKNLFIIAKKISSKTQKLFSEFIVEIPKLEDWQIKDFVYSNLEGIDSKKLDWLISICNYDIYRLNSEIGKLKLFQPNERKYLFDNMVYEGAFNDLSSQNVFNITNAVTNKNISQLVNALKEIKNFDAEPLGVVTLLYQGFRKMIQVWLSKNPTPENTGLKSNVIYAINKSPRVYTKEQLLKCFLELTDIDRKIKTGNFDMNVLIDYVICKVLTC